MTGERSTSSSPGTSRGSRRGCASGAATPRSSPRSSTTRSWSSGRSRASTRATARSRRGCGGSRSAPCCTGCGRGSRSSSGWSGSAPEHVPSAEDAVLLGVEHGDVGLAMQRLSPELLAVVQATVLDGLSTREAAELLGIPSRHRQEPDEPRPHRAEGGTAVTTARTEWHAGEQELAAVRRPDGQPPRWPPRSRPTCSAAHAAGPRSRPAPPTPRSTQAWARLADAVDRPSPARSAGSPAGHWSLRSVGRHARPCCRPRSPRSCWSGWSRW